MHGTNKNKTVCVEREEKYEQVVSKTKLRLNRFTYICIYLHNDIIDDNSHRMSLHIVTRRIDLLGLWPMTMALIVTHSLA